MSESLLQSSRYSLFLEYFHGERGVVVLWVCSPCYCLFLHAVRKIANSDGRLSSCFFGVFFFVVFFLLLFLLCLALLLHRVVDGV